MLTGLGYAFLYFVFSAVLVSVVLFIDERLNPAYKLWEEIRRGNDAVGLATAGKIIGLALITMTAVQHNETIFSSIVWTFIGALFQLAGYYLFELATPKIAVGKELAAGNRAVGLVSMGISLGLSLVVAACIA